MSHDYRLDLDRLQQITKDCRPDMHEPDEQGIRAIVVGDHLDNARGISIGVDQITGGYQEYVVVIERRTEDVTQVERFNLANLIALARKAV